MLDVVTDTPRALLDAALRRDPAGPLLTFYDDATGERVELSATTLENWVAKTANLLQDGLAVQPGGTVAVLLPVHWQAAVAVLAAWSVGAEVAYGADGADVAFAAPDRLAEAAAADEVVGLSLRPLGGRLDTAPAGVLDFATEVPPQGDRFVPYGPVGEAGAVLAGRAREVSLARGDRLLSVLPYDGDDALVTTLLAPLAAGAGVVLCRHPDAAALPGRAEQEHVTVTAGLDLPGLRRLC